jgi:hypothetical protein
MAKPNAVILLIISSHAKMAPDIRARKVTQTPALDASSVKPMWREIGAFVSKWPTGTIQAAPC